MSTLTGAPNFTLNQTTKAIERTEGQTLVVTLQEVEFGYAKGSLSVRFQDKVFTDGNGFNTAESGSNLYITFPPVYRNNSGSYQVILSNSHSIARANFTLNVVCEFLIMCL